MVQIISLKYFCLILFNKEFLNIKSLVKSNLHFELNSNFCGMTIALKNKNY